MYTVEGIKENVHRTHVVESNKYIIYIAPKDDWLVLNINFCESLIYNMVHYYVGKQRSNGRTHCYAVYIAFILCIAPAVHCINESCFHEIKEKHSWPHKRNLP